MVSRSFGRPITSLTEMREAVATYTTRAAEKLRRHRVAAGVVTVFLMTNGFTDEPQYSNSVTIPLPVATQDTAELIRYALRGVEQIFSEGYRYQKAGVILTALVPAHQIQAHLFDQKDRERSQQLMAAIDAINRVRTRCGGPPPQEDRKHATHQNVSPHVCRCRCIQSRNPCPAAHGTGQGAGIHWYWGTSLPRTSGRGSPAGRRVPSAGGCGPASGSVWLCAGRGWRILRTPISPLEIPSPPLAPLVMLPSLDAALPCRVAREGLCCLPTATAYHSGFPMQNP
jgi:impB/mucB/samB family C-terminal domain